MILLVIITCILFLAQSSFLEINLGNFYYLSVFGVFIVLLLFGKDIKFNLWLMLFLLIAFLSITFNQIPLFFRPYERFVIFVLVVGLIGPMVSSSAFNSYRRNLWDMLNLVILAMVILSFLGITFGLSSMYGRGGYAGFFNHSMMLGPMSALAVLVAMGKIHGSNYKIQKVVFILLASISFITCVAAGSRSALLGCIGGVVFFSYKIYEGRIIIFLRVILVILSLGLLSFPLWEKYTARLTEKMVYGSDQGDLLVTRAALWQSRFEEFKSSPLIGVGFASIDTKSSQGFNKIDGKIEPGSSWLAILSMTGLLGFISIFAILIQNFAFVISNGGDSINKGILGAMLVFFVLHMTAEGYALSAGSGLFFYFWLIMGNIQSFKSHNA